MSSLTDSVAIFNYHRGMINTHGRESSFALGWKDVESQQIRFKALAGIGDLSGRSVLDTGCGYGDFLPYLSASYQDFTYTGMEQIPELLKEAVVRYRHLPETTFIQGNFTTAVLPAVDYVFASGSLNYRSTDPEFIFKVIDKLYGACNYGFAFNLLNHIVPNGLLVAYNPKQIISYCSSICPEVKLIQDYDPNDFTVYMYKQKDLNFNNLHSVKN
jgi:SAM-dependent methyltransferase